MMFVLVAILCSAGFMIPWKLAAGLGGSTDMVFILCFVAAIFNTVTLFAYGGKSELFAKPTSLEWGLSALFAVFTLVGNQASAMAVKSLAPAVVTTIMRSEVVFITLLAWFFLKERVAGRFWVGVIFVVAGFWLMQPELNISNTWWHGALFAIGASLTFAVMVVITRAKIHDINPSRVNGIRLWFSVIAWFLIYRKMPSFDKWTLDFFLLVSLAAILGPCIGRLALMFSSKYLEARITAMMVCCSPVVALVLAWLIIDDVPRYSEIVGGAVIVFGTTISLIRRRRKEVGVTN